ncbi:MAG: hypothetical protein M1822_004078 [Bathelium mastoideum]|nr:MAG: hypothetical protein M1822_004078 [Bathelium mastoideum]
MSVTSMRCRFLWLLLCALFNIVYSTSGVTVTPLSIPPSLYWDGDDGWWSTFQIQVGTPGQTVRLLPGTSANAGSTIWVVISEGCVDVNPDLTNCPNERGYVFQSNLSTSWSTQGIQNGIDGAIFSLNTFEEGILGLTGNGSYGYDNVRLGLPGSDLPTLQKQVIAGIWTDNYFLGSLGLSPIPFNFTNLDDPQPSMLGTLRNQSLIPSASWAYAAGAHYQDPPVYGSLTLGGFDASRFQPNNLTFAFAADFSRDLLVSLQSITYDTTGSSPLLASSIDIFIDSLVTELWLPVNVCEAFARQFNLTWNTQGQLYLLDETAHAALLAQNPTFIFTIGQAGGGGDTTDIVLPYAAFDLNLTSPIVGNTTRYFPLKQAQNSSQYTLGRTFLQAAYLIADYERRNFSVSRALFPSTSVSENIIAIHPPNGDLQGKESHRLGKGAITGIAVSVAAVLALAVAAVTSRRRCIKARRQAVVSGIISSKESAVKVKSDAELDNTDIHQLEGQKMMKVELPAYENSLGRHEIDSNVRVHELGSQELPVVELDASQLLVQ